MGKLIALAIALGVAAAIVVYVVARWQVDRSPASPASGLASALVAEETGQPGVPPAPAPRVSLRWPAITGIAVAVVVGATGAVYIATSKE
ncbi:MAG TPA: hypothetical protein VFQ80_02390 [Thermomicrobiales bacterium]|jgi:hypothetical protein|nr:hypothetical protein [Thermomicrobiales bacterium]